MKNIMLRSALIFLLLSFVVTATCQQQKATTIILVRHAEKDTVGGSDPALSAIGVERAARLHVALKEFTPDTFYSTDFKRTKETLTPWAKALNKNVEVYDVRAPDAFVAQLKTFAGKTTVVAGHSNTVPPLVNLLANTTYQNLPDNEYGKIFIVTISPNGEAKVEERAY